MVSEEANTTSDPRTRQLRNFEKRPKAGSIVKTRINGACARCPAWKWSPNTIGKLCAHALALGCPKKKPFMQNKSRFKYKYISPEEHEEVGGYMCGCVPETRVGVDLCE